MNLNFKAHFKKGFDTNSELLFATNCFGRLWDPDISLLVVSR
ncbi:hypothetical protein LEP1GSC062_0679 [Leptospira alexanderi serovar Manhao 3 str. L 60]|uniref:Uncharacterized protein n=1 Tax=Leptospira alexanderi serovar Manhao 3 str. L 60 TaxID=1049759 RepID=V6I366_9LEPT|nr:hypothetical protein LEP1GSC062_0679 [Leptospira alexanderi serovar Manhao 3 str. L 60]